MSFKLHVISKHTFQALWCNHIFQSRELFCMQRTLCLNSNMWVVAKKTTKKRCALMHTKKLQFFPNQSRHHNAEQCCLVFDFIEKTFIVSTHTMCKLLIFDFQIHIWSKDKLCVQVSLCKKKKETTQIQIVSAAN